MNGPGADVTLRDAAALSLHWLRGDAAAVETVLGYAEAEGAGALADLVLALLSVGKATGVKLGGGEAYTAALTALAGEAALGAEGLRA